MSDQLGRKHHNALVNEGVKSGGCFRIGDGRAIHKSEFKYTTLRLPLLRTVSIPPREFGLSRLPYNTTTWRCNSNMVSVLPALFLGSQDTPKFKPCGSTSRLGAPMGPNKAINTSSKSTSRKEIELACGRIVANLILEMNNFEEGVRPV